MLLQLIHVSVVCWLPGAVIFRLPWFDRDRRAALPADERIFWNVILSLCVSLCAVLALASVHRYTFQRLLLADVLVAAGAALASRGRLRLGPHAARPGFVAIIPIALAVLGLMRFFPPAEYVMGGKDPGVYVNQGVQIAQRGGLVVTDPVVADVPAFARDLFYPSHERPNNEYYGLRFMGFFIKDPAAGTVVGQFPHLFPASIAIGYGIDGLTGVRRTAGLWGILGVLAVYFAGARLAGRTVAATAACLLALHVIQVWWGRYPNADIVMQSLLFAALLASARAHVDGDLFFAPVAATLLGLLLFLRFDAVLGIAGVLAGLALGGFAGHRLRAAFAVPLAAFGIAALAYYLGPMRAYIETPILFLGRLPAWQYLALAAAALACVAAWAFLHRSEAVSRAVVKWAPMVIASTLAAGAVYALWFRQPGGKLTDYDAFALRTFTNLYFTLPGILGAVIGFALLARRAFWKDPAFFVTLTIFACFLFYKIRIVPEQFWMTRRFLPVILPGALLCVGAAAFSGLGSGRMAARAVRGALGLVFVGLLAAQFARTSRPLLAHTEYAGLIPSLEAFAATIDDGDLLLVEARDAGGDTHVAALPLAYIYAKQVLVLSSAKPPKETFAAFIDWARTKYKRVLFAAGAGTDLVSYRYGIEPVGAQRFDVPEYDTTPWDRLPRGAHSRRFDFGVYSFTRAGPRDARPFDVDVGMRDDLHVLRFHAREESGGITYRWTQSRSYISLGGINAGSQQVTIWASNGGRPPAVAPADVLVHLDGEMLGVIRVNDRFDAHSLTIPAALAGRISTLADPVELRLTTTTWNPLVTLGTPDDRELGVMVDRVAVR